MKVRYGIRWDGKVRPRTAGAAAVFVALALWAAPAARGDGVTQPDPGAGAANTAMKVVAGGSGVLPSAPDGSGVDVALIDSGVAPVAGLANVVYGPDFSDEASDPDLAGLDTFGHGTHLAGIIAGNDPVTGFTGVAPGARLVSVKISGAEGETGLSQVMAALDWVRRNRRANGMDIRVVNLALGVEDRGGYRNDVLAWAVEQLWHEGIAVVAAAGNNGAFARRLDIPAADPFVIAAGATDTYATPDPADDRVAWFSSRSALRPPDVVAPGTGMVSLRVPGSVLDEEFPAARVGEAFFRGSGTSQAAAVVTGLAARVLSAHPGLTPDQLKAMLRAGAVDLPDEPAADGAGRVDLARTLALPVPDAAAVRQTWPAAALNSAKAPKGKAKGHAKHDDRHVETVNSEWSGRRWSGRRWSGRRWSDEIWAGRRWSGASWIDG